MSDPKKTLRGWRDQLLGLLTGSRRRWIEGAKERARQRDNEHHARQARDRQRSRSAAAGGPPNEPGRANESPQARDKKDHHPRPDRPTPSDSATLVERDDGAHAEFLDEPDTGETEPPSQHSQTAP